MDAGGQSGNGKSSLEESLSSLFFYKRRLIISLEEMRLKVNQPTRIRIVYNYPLVDEKENFNTGIFLIKPGTEAIQTIGNDNAGAFWEHELKQKWDDETLREYFKGNLLEIKLMSKNEQLGQVTIDPLKLFDPQSQKVSQMSFKDWIDIISNNGEKIGTMNCLIVLTNEKQVNCKFCKKSYGIFAIKKHLNSPFRKHCKDAFSDGEIDAINNSTNARRKQKENSRKRQGYDPLQRSEIHKTTYNSEKRAKKYRQEENEYKIKKGCFAPSYVKKLLSESSEKETKD